MANVIVLSAVYFDSEADCRAVKVYNVFSYRMLTAKPHTIELSLSQRAPKLFFRPRGSTPQVTSARGGAFCPRKPRGPRPPPVLPPTGGGRVRPDARSAIHRPYPPALPSRPPI